jgi:hypothetical protein
MNDRQHRPPAKRRRDCAPKRTCIAADEVVQLLKDVEWHRARLADAGAVLSDWLTNSPDFSQAWHDFTACGGISGNDFHAFMSGNFRPRPGVRQHYHLRLIAARPAPSIRRCPITRRDNNPDPEAS